VDLLSSSLEQKTRIRSGGMAITGIAAAIALLYYGRAFCITLIIAVILAFMLEPFVKLFMRLRLPRGAAALVVCTIALLLLYLAGLALFTQLADLASDLPVYSQRMNDLVDAVAERMERAEQNAYRLLIPKRFQDQTRSTPEASPPLPKRRNTRATPATPPSPPAVQEVRIRQDRSTLMNYLYGHASSFYNALLMLSFVPFLVYFMLSWREHFHRSFLGLFQGSRRATAGRSWQTIADIARAYVVGNFLLGLFMSAVSCTIFLMWHLPYAILIGFISGFMSLVPYVGLPLALIAPLMAALMTYNTVAPFVIISLEVGVLHLLALNLLYPAVVGARVHLNPLAVTISLMFWGTIWGAVGLVLAIPITAAIKALLDNTEHMHAWGRVLGDSSGSSFTVSQ
jgi:predicted PurR-regulated permease PerM